MLSKKEIQVVESLKTKKFRQSQALFIAEGPKVVEELLKKPSLVSHIYHIAEYKPFTHHNFYTEITEKELHKLSALSTPNQVIAIAHVKTPTLGLETMKSELVLALESVRDPGNLGTIIRIADWFGIKNILCSEDCVDLYNPKTVQATMGSIFRVNVHYVNLNESLGELKKTLPIYATSLDGENIYSSQLNKNGVLLVGNEANGLSREILGLASHRLHIPSFNEGDKAESLNAAFACAIACSEFRRR